MKFRDEIQSQDFDIYMSSRTLLLVVGLHYSERRFFYFEARFKSRNT